MADGPVAVGGVGGSATRVVAQLLSDAGVYLGGDLNEALDNRWFTLLFKRPEWYRRNLASDGEPFRRALAAFAAVMTRGRGAALRSLPLLVGAATEMSRTGHDPSGFAKGLWPYRRVATMLRARSLAPEARWGWKEPNTHLFLAELVAGIPDLRYVHVMRHGLDMAFSRNQLQLHNWGPLLGIEPVRDAALLPRASLEFWIIANKRAIEVGAERLGPRFLLVNVEDLWRTPDAEVARLLDFAGLGVSDASFQRMVDGLSPPPTAGRHRQEDLTQFRPEQLDAVRRLGFAVDDPTGNNRGR